jgi:squalene synthase HpnC/squalene synthase HpnD
LSQTAHCWELNPSLSALSNRFPQTMSSPAIDTLEIARGLPPLGCSVAEAQAYTRHLARNHYENFGVVSWLLPRRLHQHFYNVYAYCRWSDDIADEIPDRAEALASLGDWEMMLRRCYAGDAQHPVFIALTPTIRACDIPIEPFADLLTAFRQDQVVSRYATWDDMLGYCRYSANPVGRLVLYLCGYSDAARQQLSDATCTALQLSNFWQDVGRDREKNRIYIPLDSLARHGLTPEEIEARVFDQRYVALMRELITRTRELFAAGMPLARSVDPGLRVDIELFSRGGMAVLDAIEASGYDTLRRRPAIGRALKLRLLARALVGRAISPLRGSAAPAAPVAALPTATAEPGRPVLVQSSPSPPAVVEPARSHTKTEADALEISRSYDDCREVARAAASNFYYAFYLLPRPKRDALCALYAFMRLVDDVSDTPGDLAAKRAGLARWRAALDTAVAGDTSAHPVLPALAYTLERFRIPPRYFHDLISGAEMDLTVGAYATFDRLREYCYRVAGTVGLTCLHVFGFTDPRAPDRAESLGIAFQLTNILRDVRRDLEIGRIYLPQEDLDRFGRTTGELIGETITPGLRALMEFETARAWMFYREGEPLVRLVDRDSRAALWALVRTYSGLLGRIEARGYDVFSERTRLTTAEKAGILVRARFGWFSQQHVLEERDRDRRRPGGTFRGRRAG